MYLLTSLVDDHNALHFLHSNGYASCLPQCQRRLYYRRVHPGFGWCSHCRSRAWMHVCVPLYCWYMIFPPLVRALGCLRVGSIVDDHVRFLVDNFVYVITVSQWYNIDSLIKKRIRWQVVWWRSLCLFGVLLMFEFTPCRSCNLVHFILICHRWRFFYTNYFYLCRVPAS